MPHNETNTHPFSLDPWRLRETQFDVNTNYLAETLFALGNGTVGLRGTHEENYAGPTGTSQEGNYVNGFYESEPITYPESAYGLAHTNQFMLNLPNAKRVELWLDDEQFNLMRGTVHDYERTLDFRTGILKRTVLWESPKGKRISLVTERLVSFTRRHLFAIRYQLTALNFDGQIFISSAIDTTVNSLTVDDDPRVGNRESGTTLQLQQHIQTPAFCALEHRTGNSGFTVVSAMSNDAPGWQAAVSNASSDTTAAPGVDGEASKHNVQQRFSTTLRSGATVSLTKYGCYFSSRDYPVAELLDQSLSCLSHAKLSGFDVLCLEQKKISE